ncbi:MAG: transposase [Culicoidibacterales bacterium]
MAQYDKETREKCIQLRLTGRTIKSISDEYGLGTGTLKYWMDEYEKTMDPTAKEKAMESKELRKRIDELEKENAFLKKAASYFASSQKR